MKNKVNLNESDTLENFDDEGETADILFSDNQLNEGSEDVVKEIVAELVDYAVGQGDTEPTDEELKGIIDDYLYEKIDQGEIPEDTATDVLRGLILSSYKHKMEDFSYEEDEDEF